MAESREEADEIEMVCLRTNQLVDRWKSYFQKYDMCQTGAVTREDFAMFLDEIELEDDVDAHKMELLRMQCADPDKNCISYQEFINIMSNRRNPSFKSAVQQREDEGWSSTYIVFSPETQSCFQKMVHRVSRDFLTDDTDRQYFADRYTCWPPPVFVPLITVIEISFFIYYCASSGSLYANRPVPVDSLFIYRPDRRMEIWRFLLYILVHAGWVHIFFNMLLQVLIGIPLEMIHGSIRVGTIYVAGVLAGSLGASVFDMDGYLAGASGGVYAFLAAHLANIVLNYAQMELGILKLAAVLVLASVDVGFAIWDRYSAEDQTPPVSYTAHLMGALAGVTIGLVVLKNFEQRLHDQYIWWICLAVYMTCVGLAIIWNIFYY